MPAQTRMFAASHGPGKVLLSTNLSLKGGKVRIITGGLT